MKRNRSLVLGLGLVGATVAKVAQSKAGVTEWLYVDQELPPAGMKVIVAIAADSETRIDLDVGFYDDCQGWILNGEFAAREDLQPFAWHLMPPLPKRSRARVRAVS